MVLNRQEDGSHKIYHNRPKETKSSKTFLGIPKNSNKDNNSKKIGV